MPTKTNGRVLVVVRLTLIYVTFAVPIPLFVDSKDKNSALSTTTIVSFQVLSKEYSRTIVVLCYIVFGFLFEAIEQKEDVRMLTL